VPPSGLHERPSRFSKETAERARRASAEAHETKKGGGPGFDKLGRSSRLAEVGEALPLPGILIGDLVRLASAGVKPRMGSWGPWEFLLLRRPRRRPGTQTLTLMEQGMELNYQA